MDDCLYGVYHQVEDTWWWSGGRRALITGLWHKYRNTKERPRILEIGCGTGGLLKELSVWSTAYGLDISPEAAKFCLERDLDRVSLGDVTSLPFKDEQFDAVVCVDVLEHVDDDGQALREVRRICKPHGRLIATVPAFQFLWSRRDVQLHHKRRYTLGQLKGRVRREGFRILKASYVNLPLFVPLLVMVKLGMLRKGASLEVDYALVPGPINRLLSMVFRMESQLVTSTDIPLGTSIVCVAAKAGEA